ncbi:hypothetical protein [Schaalia canis]|uniref:Tetratricopeptide repeat protein n=1 Tax=Schaalia canis TaxID=100469 RepID=A0A3P1SG95_9ACTO|nr:hypothetical protein [Schaalia canis]RRC96313.1 hypothetical protein EII11_01285 [Schaalia canis]
MSEGLDDLEDLMSRADATQWGKACSALWAQAATLAEEQGNLEKAVVCYDELATAYMMGGELTRCIAPFMWLERMYKQRPDLFNDDLVESLAADYKFALSAVRSVPTVPFEQCMSLLEETERFHRSLGDSLHSYNMRAFQIYRDMGMMEESEAAYQRWLAAESSPLSDCSHCDPGHRVRYHAERSEWAEALSVGDETLNSDKRHCGAQPEALLTDLLETLLRSGRDDEAWAAHIRGYRRYQQASRYFEYHEQHLRYLALSGRAGRPQRLERGVKILLRHMPWWKEAETPQVLMDTAIQAFVLLDSFESDHDDRVLPVTLPGDELQWTTRPTLVNPTLSQARDWMRDLALAMADAFDARPGHPHPGVMRARVERLMDPEPVAPLTQEGVVEDASGLGDYTMMSTFAVADDTTQTSAVGATAGQVAPHGANDEDEDEPPLVPLPLNGPWQSMGFMELLEAAAEYGDYVPTIYVAMARELAFRDPTLIDPSYRPQGEGRLQQYWDATVEYVNVVKQIDEEFPDYPRVCDDRAYQLVQESDHLLDQRKYMEAAQLADEAMRTPSVEPIGVRLEALTNLSMAAIASGYLAESVDSLRELINLNALLGLRVDQAGVSILLTNTLHKLRRYTEATEVAQSGLDIFEHYPHLYGPAVELNRLAALAHAQFSKDAAANRHFAAGMILERQEIWRGAAGAYGEAADGYAEGHEYSQAIVARDLALKASRRYFAECDEALAAYRATHLGDETLAEPENEGDAESVGGADREKNSAEEELVDNYKYAIEQLLSCLLDYAHILVWQPGNISDEDFSHMEELMNELRSFVTNPTFDEYMPKTVAWRDADWHRRMSTMMANAYRRTLAVDYMLASIQAFKDLGDTRAQGRSLQRLAALYDHLEQPENAREAAQAVIDLFADPSYRGEEALRDARKLLRELDKADEN